MNTIAAERIQPLDELLALAQDEPVRIVLGADECLVVLSPEDYQRLRRGRRQVSVTTEAPKWLLEALDQTIEQLRREAEAEADTDEAVAAAE